MQLEKPKVQRTYITATDAETKRRKCVTVYGSTPEDVVELFRKSAESKPRRERRTVNA